MIEIAGLVKFYGERRVLHELDFSVNVGRVCGFLGPNGSGKSTTMDIIAGLLGPSDGSVKVCGYDVVTQVIDVKANVGYLPDNPPLHREMIVRDFVDYVAQLRGIKGANRTKAVDQVLDDCDVRNVENRVIGNLSKGYRQRVALCSALVHNPKVLILDEPTEGLDPNQILQIRKLVRKLASDRTVIMSSHILSEVQATCDDVIVINEGSIVTKTSLTDSQNAHAPYLFSFAEKADEALKWFQAKTFTQTVASVSDKVNTLAVSFSNDFWRDFSAKSIAQINASLVQQGFSVASFHQDKKELERLYFDVINAKKEV